MPSFRTLSTIKIKVRQLSSEAASPKLQLKGTFAHANLLLRITGIQDAIKQLCTQKTKYRSYDRKTGQE